FLITCPMKQPLRVTVPGPAGQIGYALLFRIASGQMFGPDQPIILQLLEVPVEKIMNALKGVAMELEDCAFPLLQDMVLTSDPTVGFKDANWCLLVGAKPRGAGMERADLLKDNGKMFIAFHLAKINGKPVPEKIGHTEWLRTELQETVGKRGTAVITARGSSSAASAANALVDHVHDLMTPGRIHSVAVKSNGEYGFA